MQVPASKWFVRAKNNCCCRTRLNRGRDDPKGRDEHVPESSVEILGHPVGGITYRHYAHRAPVAFRAIITLPRPTAFQALVRGSGSECPFCRRRFADAG
jgi:hypothetical protein